MNVQQINQITKRIAKSLNHSYKYSALEDPYYNDAEFGNDVEAFINALSDQLNRTEIALLRNEVTLSQFEELATEIALPILTFIKRGEELQPLLILQKQDKLECFCYQENEAINSFEEIKGQLYEQEGNIVYMTPFPIPPLLSTGSQNTEEIKAPIKRLFKLLTTEKRDIIYIYFYAVIISLISLTLPLGTQAIMELVGGGVIFNSIVLLIVFVILGVMTGGILQILQYSIVETLQRRVFTKAAFEFVYRMPKVRTESVLQYYTPELMNRFFDVLTIQKGLPKLLIELVGTTLQIFVGLILLAFYHPLFVFFGMTLLGVLIVIFYWTGQSGLKTSIIESKYKYKVAHWLEEVARTLNSFKMAGHTPLPISKMETHLNNYLYYRKKHFTVLITQFGHMIAFETFITGGLLILGSFLVINRQITIGQFIASEIVIILIINSIQKMIASMSTVYDMLTAVDKIGYVTDLPLERRGGILLPRQNTGVQIRIRNLRYKYPDSEKYSIKGIDLDIKAGERTCLAGTSASGKNTFIKIISGILESYEGAITVNNISLRDINLSSWRDVIGKNVSIEDIFDGTILENINMGKPSVSFQDVMWACENLGMLDHINSLPKGFMTELIAGGKQASSGFIIKIILARTIAKRPQLLILNDFLHDLHKEERLRIINFLLDKKNPWALIAVSSEASLLASCDRILFMDNGAIEADGNFQELLRNQKFVQLMLHPKVPQMWLKE